MLDPQGAIAAFIKEQGVELHCPVCNQVLKTPSSWVEVTVNEPYEGGQFRVNCDVCGTYDLSQVVLQDVRQRFADSPELAPLISYAIRKMQKEDSIPLIRAALFKKLTETTLPPLQEQAENLITWLGDKTTSSPGSPVDVMFEEVTPIIGSPDKQTARFVIKSMQEKGYLADSGHTVAFAPTNLTFDGWKYYEELKHTASESYLAFMAMPFRNEALDKVYKECFKPAVAKTGFELRRVDENAPAGLIDNRIRVEIRKAQFLIAELTNDNSGAYWEAGFAEGLGRPVIYTCEKTFFEKNETHFDTNHCHTIVWSFDDLGQASEALKATIRATLPTKAALSDI